jgi:hypothetical protein
MKHYARCTREIRASIAMTIAPFNKKQIISASKMGLNLRKKLYWK